MRISDWSSDVCSSDLIVEAHERRIIRQHRPRYRLAPQSLLKRVKACCAALRPALMAAAHQQFAVQSRRYLDRGDDFGEPCRNIVARARIEPRPTAGVDDLHGATSPSPPTGIVRLYSPERRVR